MADGSVGENKLVEQDGEGRAGLFQGQQPGIRRPIALGVQRRSSLGKGELLEGSGVDRHGGEALGDGVDRGGGQGGALPAD